MPIVTAEFMPETVTGAVLLVVVPSPNLPEPLLPQHFTAPELKSAQEVEKEAEIATAELIPETVTGVALLNVVPFPS